MQYLDQSVYEGEVSASMQREGYGVLTFKDGVYYEGNWKDNRMNGKGILYYRNKEKAYEGEWCEDKFNNYGHLYNQYPKKLETNFDYNDLNNIGDQWLKYEGEFKMDLKDSFGVLYLTNGEKFAGNFSNDMANGYGTFHQMDGNPVAGYWEDNKFVRSI